jgi:Domain of unknown function (DUF929)
MGKGERNRQQNARERIAAQQAAARKAENRRRLFIAGGSVLAVIVIIVGLVIFKTTSKPGKTTGAPTASASLETQVAYDIAHVPASALNKVGAGPSGANAIDPLQVPKKKVAVLMLDGKPEMLYVGAEYCPFCGAERWAMAVALSRFGTFTGLHLIHSDSDDIYSNTMTLSFYQSTFTSKYLTFVPVETTTEDKATLQTPTAAENKLMNTYDVPPYVPSSAYDGSFPFIDIGNQYVDDGAQYEPSVLGTTENVDASHYGLTWQEIASDLSNPNSSVGQAILGTANDLTAGICKVTGGQPGSVCNSPGVKAISQI